jgi:hypothetical protein
VLSLGVKNADAIQEAFKFTQPGPVLLVVSRPFSFLSWPLDELGWSAWHESFSFFCPLVSRVTSLGRAYLLAMVNIASDVWGVFMATLKIRDRSLVAEMPDELPEGLSLLLDDAG